MEFQPIIIFYTIRVSNSKVSITDIKGYIVTTLTLYNSFQIKSTLIKLISAHSPNLVKKKYIFQTNA